VRDWLLGQLLCHDRRAPDAGCGSGRHALALSSTTPATATSPATFRAALRCRLPARPVPRTHPHPRAHLARPAI